MISKINKSGFGFVFTVLIIAFFSFFPAFLPAREFVDIIGGQHNESGNCIVFDEAEDSFVIVGATDNKAFGKVNAFITKYSRSAVSPFLTLQWARAIGTGENDQANCVVIDGSYYVLCGFTSNPTGTKKDLLLAKIKKNGTVEFKYSYDVQSNIDGTGKSGEIDRLIQMIVDKDRNYVTVGTTYNNDAGGDILVAKFDSNGNFLRATMIGGTRSAPDETTVKTIDSGSAIIQDSDDDYVVVGYTNFEKDIVIIKLDPVSLSIRPSASKRLHLTSSGIDFAWAIVDDPDTSSYVLAGRTTKEYSGKKRADLLIFKINYALDTTPWIKFLSQYNREEVAKSLIKIGDKFVVAGFSGHMPEPETRADALFAEFTGDGVLTRLKTSNIASTPSGAFELSKVFSITNVTGSTGDIVYVATGFTKNPGPSAGVSSALGGHDILVTSFTWDDVACFNNLSRTTGDLGCNFYDFGPAIPCTLVRTPVHSIALPPEIMNICRR